MAPGLARRPDGRLSGIGPRFHFTGLKTVIRRHLPAWLGLRLALVLALLFPLVVDLHAETPPWADQEFYYEAADEPLADMLRAFCQKYNLAAVLSPGISGKVSGHFRFNRAVDFLDAVSRAHGLSWYYNGPAIYFDKLEEHKSAMLRLRWISPDALRSTLKNMGLLDTRFPWRSIANERMVSISGPPVYIDTILGLVRDMEKNAAEDKEMRVFRLRHAWADDITINNQGSTVTIPGVATLLRNITGEGPIETGGTAMTLTPTNPQSRLGQGLARTSANSRTEGFSSEAPPDQSRGSSRILADPRLNAVIVWDVRERMGQYAKTIEQLDQPVRLVEIQVAILEVSVNRVSELGVSWVGQSTGGSVGVGGVINNAGPSPLEPNPTVGSGLNVSTIYSRGLDYLLARVHALEENGDAAILSRPKVLTMDNTQATLEHVSTFYVRVEGKDVVDLFDVTYGTVLTVTPHVEEGPDGAHIRMFIQIDDGNNQSSSQGQVDNLPIVGRSSIKTQAVVKENQTLIIGGYYYEKVTSGESGVPGLMKVPILGYLFKTDKDDVQKIERLFAIAPRLVDLAQLPSSPSEMPPDTFTRDMISAQTGPASGSGGGCAGRSRRSAS
jgi:type III secretion protein C